MESMIEVPITSREDNTCQSRKVREIELIRRAQSGDSSSFEALFEPHMEKLRRTVGQIVRNTHDTEDIIQQCMLQVFTKLGQFRGDSQFSTWLCRIAINISLMHLRKNRTVLVPIDTTSRSEDQFLVIDIPDPNSNPEEVCSARETKGLLRDCIDRLPRITKSVVKMLYLNDLSMEETGTLLGLSTAATKSRALRARKQLQSQMCEPLCCRRGRNGAASSSQTSTGCCPKSES